MQKDTLVITESGIKTPRDIRFFKTHGVYSFLIGESFMREADPGKAVAQFIA